MVGRWSSTARSVGARLTTYRVVAAIVVTTVATSTVVGPLACGVVPDRPERSVVTGHP